MNEYTHDRRGFLVLGGAVGAAALLAACGDDDEGGSEPVATTTTTIASARDVNTLRTASSLEKLEVAIYKRAIDGGLITSPGALDTVKLLQAHHVEHAAVFDGHTSRLGGEPFPDPNPALLQQIQGRLTDEAGVLRAAFDVAQIVAATHQAAVGNVDDGRLNLLLMSIAGVEARHAALVGNIANLPLPAGSLATLERAYR